MAKKFALVWWIKEDKFGVTPVKAAKGGGDDLYVGLKTEMKFKSSRKFYDVEILNLSGSSV